ncbi:hypothetical protein AUK40_06605 [Candidatus Wirthbacteria bacterium CG2_30_54_11]|uniref:Uncharacterized protein n=1 Tax=Candidatus Wirthbacteria bacterium CG2_30_54_11 TaxID=1817892 RepID=A0A1J5IK68_9BACT|nr:MAG: hypothetical protein AUK40_06605 [Candidatus Wirthbacteria bacterium CG2_30_54_11]
MSASLSANKRFRLDTLAEEPLSLEVGIEELGNVSVRALMSLGLSITEAEVTARSLLFGQSWQSTSGYNDKGEPVELGLATHGLVRIVQYIRGLVERQMLHPGTEPVLVAQSEAMAVLDGEEGNGYYGARVAFELAMAEARANGSSTVYLRNMEPAGNCLAEFALQAAEAGFVCRVVAAPSFAVAHPEDVTATKTIGTTAICYGCPSEGEPMILDYTSAAITFGEVLRRRQTGQPLPEHSCRTKEGIWTTIAEELFDGEAFTGRIVAASIPDWAQAAMVRMHTLVAGEGTNKCNFSVEIIDPASLGDLEVYRRRVTEWMNLIVGLNHDQVRTPGNHSLARYQANIDRGSVPVNLVLWDQLQQLAAGDIPAELPTTRTPTELVQEMKYYLATRRGTIETTPLSRLKRMIDHNRFDTGEIRLLRRRIHGDQLKDYEIVRIPQSILIEYLRSKGYSSIRVEIGDRQDAGVHLDCVIAEGDIFDQDGRRQHKVIRVYSYPVEHSQR